MTTEGLARRRLRRTRGEIADAAMGLFAQRGFDEVTVAEVAAAARVSEKTVFNHFQTKADLVFDADQGVVEGLVAAVGERGVGESALEAVRRFLAGLAASFGQGESRARRQVFRRVVTASPALRAHQRVMAARYEDALAAVLAEQTGVVPGSAEPFVVAVALVGALRAGFDAAPASGGPAAAMSRALDVLAAGLDGYAVRASGTVTNTATDTATPVVRGGVGA
jgi:AcrR family transcriptional regulator